MIDGHDISEHESESAIWIAMSDLMTGLMAIFLVISIFIFTNQDRTRMIIIKGVQDALKKAKINVTTDPVTGDVSIVNQDLLFANGSDKLSHQGKEFLNQFVPSYTHAIFSLDPSISNEVIRIVVEGRTSSLGHTGQNTTLSLNRANAVVQYIYEMPDFSGRAKMVQRLTPVGRGEMEAEQRFDNPNNREVVFRFQFKGELLNREKKADQFTQDLQNTSAGS
jgi:outer membrane protein OmpA-like peptidoglycan-associated protein